MSVDWISVRRAAFLFFFGVGLAACVREKDLLDEQVRKLCFTDGGVKIYEQISLNREEFDEFGVVSVPLKTAVRANDRFFYEWNITYLKKGSPELSRSHFRLLRQADGKLLGESVAYTRRGGDFPGPWMESSYRCPQDSDISVLKQRVFTRRGERQ